MIEHDVADILRTASGQIKRGRADEGLAVLRVPLRQGLMGAEEMDRAGRLIRKALAADSDPGKTLRVALVGQFTTSWVGTMLTAEAWGRGTLVEVSEGGFDTVLQDLASLSSSSARPDVVVLLPWNQRLFGADHEARVADELGFWRQAWKIVRDQVSSRILQAGYDWVTPGASGAHLGGGSSGRVRAVRTTNDEIRRNLPAGSYFLDLELVSGSLGRDRFYDMRRYYWTKQPFSEDGMKRLVGELWAGIRALTTGPKKVLVLDLDNTLWGGVVGETGPLGVALGDSPDGEAFRAFQKHLKELTRRGIVLAVASKNNPNDAREVFEKNPDVALRLDDFAAFEACWEPKSVSIRRIAETLNLGLDSFVFFDDNPAERELIRQAQPEVEVVEVPPDPAEYVRALESGAWFEATALTRDDENRAAQYAVERKRRELEESYSSIDDYLRSLEMWADVRDIDEADLTRVVQLLSKTNQFNLTTRRHTREDVLGMLERPASIGMTLRVEDRFGDHGLVSVLIAVPGSEPDTIRIDTWLMSCRVIGRTVEQFFFRLLMERSRELGYRRIVGEYIPTKKNALVAELYGSLGFRRLSSTEGDAACYELDLAEATPPPCLVGRRTSTGSNGRADQAEESSPAQAGTLSEAGA